jgi:hypothetical protein
MKSIETDATPRPTKELLDNVIDGITSKMATLSVAAYQETRNNNVERGGKLSVELEAIRTAVNNLKNIREQL